MKRLLLTAALIVGGYTSTALADEPAKAASKFLVQEECRGGYSYVVRYECALRLWKDGKPVCGKWELQDMRQLFINIPTHGMYNHSDKIAIVKECK